MAHGIISPFMNDGSNLNMQVRHIQRDSTNKGSNKHVHKKTTVTWSTDLSRISNSHVSDWGKLGMEDLYVEIKFQTAAASFVGTKSRNVVIVDESRDFAVRYRTEGNS